MVPCGDPPRCGLCSNYHCRCVRMTTSAMEFTTFYFDEFDTIPSSFGYAANRPERVEQQNPKSKAKPKRFWLQEQPKSPRDHRRNRWR